MITAERLRELLEYDPLTGVFRWRSSRRGVRAGDIAGGLHPKGYIRIGIDGQHYYAHRLAWFYVYGTWPTEEIDHKSNEDRADNRFENLREASKGQNKWNSRKHIDNLGFKGAYFVPHLNRWCSKIMKDRKIYRLGWFDTAEEAHAAYVTKAAELFGEYARAA